MAAIKTEKFLDKIAKNDYKTIKLTGLANGSFCIMLEYEDGFFIHFNSNDTIKEYPKADFALTWLKRMTKANRIVIDIQLWKENN